MSATLNGYGLRPVYSNGHLTQSRRIDSGIANSYSTSLYKYQPVAINSSGQIAAASAAADFIGVFMGVAYFDASGVFHELNQWIASTAYDTAKPMYAWVLDDPNQIYQIQADGALASSVGGQVDFTTATIGSANSSVVGFSVATANASSLSTSAQKQLRIMELASTPAMNGTNAWGDAYTEVRVQIARHQYVFNKVAV